MNPLIQLKQTAPVFLVAFLLACFRFLDEAQAVVPPPDGDYGPPLFGQGNTAEGQDALLSLESGTFNTAIGFFSLSSVSTGNSNTGVGANALALNTADNNTATGAAALMSNTTGEHNTANGVSALASNTEGNGNTANGGAALFSNTTGEDNTANGLNALGRNVTGFANTAMGSQALAFNTAFDNTAIGFQALSSNTGGAFNTAIGRDSLLLNTTGGGNTGVGYGALSGHTTGILNTALGFFAGFNVIDAFNVICIGSLGDNVSNSTWIQNVYGVTPQSGNTAPVVVSNTGQLGTVASSERFKKDIANMDSSSEVILSLRPVKFHYKTDAKDTPQFGLIAEEVAKVNPALVLPDKDGKPFTVRYDAVNAMLLNEFLKEHRVVQEQGAMIARQQKQIETLTKGLQKVSAQLEVSKAAPRTVSNER
jgi:Chaperone of endosialidase